MKTTYLFPLAFFASLLMSLGSASAAKPETFSSNQVSAQTFGGARIIISSGNRGYRDCHQGYHPRRDYYRESRYRGGYYYHRPRRDYYYREYRPRRGHYYHGGYRYRGCR